MPRPHKRSVRRIGCIVFTTCFLLYCLFVLWRFYSAHYPSGHSLLKRLVVSPVPASVRLLRFDYGRGTREERAVLHFALAPQDMRKVLEAREYDRIDTDPIRAPIFMRNTYPAFSREGWPDPGRLAEPEIYESRDGPIGYRYFILTNRAHTEVYFFVDNI